ncbi:MAG: hypothetical protein ACFFCQ_07770 [Promethearchaeota archaeon]
MNETNNLESLIEDIYHFLLILLRKKNVSEKILDEIINISIDEDLKIITIDLEVISSSLSSIEALNPIINQIVEESILYGEKKLKEYDNYSE